MFRTKDVERIKTHFIFSNFFPPKIRAVYDSVSQPPGHGPVPDPGINYTGP